MRERWGGPSFAFASRVEDAVAAGLGGKKKDSERRRPEMFEVLMEEPSGEKSKRSWDHIKPIASVCVVPPHLQPITTPLATYPRFHTPPSTLSTFLRPPVRPPLPSPAPPPAPIAVTSLIEPGAEVEVVVLIALPFDPQAQAALNALRDDGEKEIPEVSLGYGNAWLS